MTYTVQDNYLPIEQYNKVENYCYNAQYTYGELDLPDKPPTGMVHNLTLNHPILNYFKKNQQGFTLYRAYINYFGSQEQPYFHQDDGNLTSLFYVHNTPVLDINENGCTELYIDNTHLVGIFPIPNRLLTFNLDSGIV